MLNISTWYVTYCMALLCNKSAHAGAQVCIIGAGKMSRLLVKHLQSKGCSAMTVLNRSLPRAEALAEEFPEVNFDIRLMPDLMPCVAASDVIFAASGSEEILVHKEDLVGACLSAQAILSACLFSCRNAVQCCCLQKVGNVQLKLLTSVMMALSHSALCQSCL